jgi:hypothetical protein
MRCGVGSHQGDWEYDSYGECAQTRRCSNCKALSTRVRHSWGNWQWVDPDDITSCESVRECSRCNGTQHESRHDLEWAYTLDIMGEPSDEDGLGLKLAAAASRALVESYTKCEQRMSCRRCRHCDYSASRTFHDWGDWQPSRRDDTSIRVCARCGEREKSG